MKIFKNNYFRNHFFLMIAAMIRPFVTFADQGITGSEYEMKLLEKVKSETGAKIADELAKFKSGLISSEVFQKSIDELKKDAEKFADLALVVKTIEGVMENQGRLLTELKNQKQGNGLSLKEKLAIDIKEWVENPEFKTWASKGYKGESPKLTLKYSLTGGERTGTVLISSTSNIVNDAFVARKLHIRDLMSVVPTDMPNHVWDKVTAWVPGFDVNSENGAAASFGITTAEQSATVKRIAGYMDISNNALRSTQYLINHIINRAPQKMLNIEDAQVLFGDGTGNNLDGIYRNATTFNLTGPAFAAASVSSIATYEVGTKTKVTFAAAHGLSNAYKITFANTTNYNAQYSLVVLSELVIVIDAAYNAEATAAWTATTDHTLTQSIENAQYYDALLATKTYMSNSEYTLNAFILNPATALKIETIKDLEADYIPKIERVNGILMIAGIPVIETNAMKEGDVLGGDWNAAVELLVYESATLQFVTDVSYVKANKTALYMSEQVLLPIYNPFMFVKGSLDTIVAAITK